MPCIVACALAACAQSSIADETRARNLRYEIVATHPHDVRAFTQGLAFLEGKLVESTGGHGRSALWLKEITSAAVRRRVALARDQFGEGVAVVGAQLVQLTWRSGVANVYDFSFARRGTFSYSGEGWGLAFDGSTLYMSDGSAQITVRDPATFAPLRRLVVTDGALPVPQLNELEHARGRLYANIWHSDRIAVIDPAGGAVEAWLDLAALKRGFAKPAGWNEAEHVLNGIAFDPRTGHFYVTGKCWPVLFELRIMDAPAS